MDIFTSTPYVFFPYDTSHGPTLPSATLIVRGSFALRRGEPAIAKPKEDQKQLRGDETYLDDIGRSLMYSTDLVPSKERGEVLVYATCHVPDEHPRPSHDVSIEVGPIHKSLHVTGPRVFVEDGKLAAVGRTAPFTVMPIRWEFAFGGLAFAPNPLGSGIDLVPDEHGRSYRHLPCIEYHDSRMTSVSDRPTPAGFGPIAPNWMPRTKLQGTRDQRWAAFRAPLPPKDFDASFYNSAPTDQQLKKGFFHGDEPIQMVGLHRGHDHYLTALPGKRVRVFALLEGNAAKGEAPHFGEVAVDLDTIHIDADKEEMVLLWRGRVAVTKAELADVIDVYVAEEDVASEPLPQAVHYERYRALKEPAPPAPLPEADMTPTDGEKAHKAIRDAEIEAQITDVKKMLVDSNVDPKVIAELDKTKDPVKMFDILEQHAREKIRELEEMTAKTKAERG